MPYALGGYAVVVEGVVLPWALAIYKEEMAPHGVVPEYVVLLPGEDEILRRGLPRPDKTEVTEAVYRQMHRTFRESVAPEAVINSTRLSRGQTADAVLARVVARR